MPKDNNYNPNTAAFAYTAIKALTIDVFGSCRFKQILYSQGRRSAPPSKGRASREVVSSLCLLNRSEIHRHSIDQ